MHDDRLRNFLTTEELAGRLRTSPGTVRYWRHVGTGPRGIKVGKRVLYDERVVDEWLAGRTGGESEPRPAA